MLRMHRTKKLFRKQSPPVGSRPGALAISKEAVKPTIRVIDYTIDDITEKEIGNAEELLQHRNSKTVSWIDVQGIGDENILNQIREKFELHPLVMADIVNVPTRPKADDYEEYLLIITRMISLNSEKSMQVEQIGIVLGKNYVLTFQERPGDVLDPVRNRIRQAKGIIRKKGNDYLAYAILDTIIDGYYPVLESFGEYLEGLEDEVIKNPDSKTLEAIYRSRRELLTLRRAIWPQRETFNSLMRDTGKLITKSVRVYLRDSYDHCVQIMDVIESYRELAGSFKDVYLSSLSHRMNEVMKTLTIIATIFIPLSFLAGVYGMNFEYIPELKVRWAYPVFWMIVVVIGAGMIGYFYRQGWIGTNKSNKELPRQQ